VVLHLAAQPLVRAAAADPVGTYGTNVMGTVHLPDAMRAFAHGRALDIRHPEAVRPWQHVLEPVRGFLMLAEKLSDQPAAFSSGWNFGPAEADSQPVGWMAEHLVAAWNQDNGTAAEWRSVGSTGPHEATLLTLSSARAKRAFGWETHWTAETAIRKTVEWYRAFYASDDVRQMTERQIAIFEKETYHGNKSEADAGRVRDVARAVPRPRIVQI
jgi:CDP-glucose 4,6-dehydratase